MAGDVLTLIAEYVVSQLPAQLGDRPGYPPGYVAEAVVRLHDDLVAVVRGALAGLAQGEPRPAPSGMVLSWRRQARAHGYPVDAADTAQGQYQLVLQPEGGRVLSFYPFAMGQASEVLYRGRSDEEARTIAGQHAAGLPIPPPAASVPAPPALAPQTQAAPDQAPEGYELVSSFIAPYATARKQALADGVLIDISKDAREANVKYPAAVSRRLWEEWITPDPRASGQPREARLWDMLHVWRYAAKST